MLYHYHEEKKINQHTSTFGLKSLFLLRILRISEIWREKFIENTRLSTGTPVNTYITLCLFAFSFIKNTKT